jgi:hypothetical protein
MGRADPVHGLLRVRWVDGGVCGVHPEGGEGKEAGWGGRESGEMMRRVL